MAKIKISGHEFAAQVVKEIATADVFSIAEAAGVKIVYENWFPVTYGEFDKKRKTVFVNLNAAESHLKIIAHELGHFFAQDLNLTGTEEETFAHGFAEYFSTDKS